MIKSRFVFFIAQFLVLVFAITLPFIATASQAWAADCSSKGISNVTGLGGTKYPEGLTESAAITFTSDLGLSAGNYKLKVVNTEFWVINQDQGTSETKALSATMSFTIVDSGPAGNPRGAFRFTPIPNVPGSIGNQKHVYLVTSNDQEVCHLGTYEIAKVEGTCTQAPQLSQKRGEKTCYYNAGSCIAMGIPTTIVLGGIQQLRQPNSTGRESMQITRGGWSSPELLETFPVSNGVMTLTHTFQFGEKYDVRLGGMIPYNGPCDADVIIRERCDVSPETACDTENKNTPSSGISPGSYKRFELCNQIIDDGMKQQCQNCMSGSTSTSKQPGVWTAIGCIGRDPESITQRLIQLGIGMGGGLCLITCLVGGFLLTTSEGNPKKVEEAREMITGAIIGLLFVLFSVIALQFIGVTIFHIPGFGELPLKK